MTRPDESNRRIAVGNTQMTRQQILDSLEDNITLAKDGAAGLLRYLGKLPSSPEQEYLLHEARSIQGHLGGVLLPLVRALRDDNQERQLPDDSPGR